MADVQEGDKNSLQLVGDSTLMGIGMARTGVTHILSAHRKKLGPESKEKLELFQSQLLEMLEDLTRRDFSK